MCAKFKEGVPNKGARCSKNQDATVRLQLLKALAGGAPKARALEHSARRGEMRRLGYRRVRCAGDENVGGIFPGAYVGLVQISPGDRLSQHHV